MDRRGFTIIEIMTVVVMVGVLAAVAIPKLVGPSEAIIAGEAKQTLIAMLGAQSRYQVETGSYADNLAQLDITLPASRYFAAPDPATDGTSSIARSGGTYTMSINLNGSLTCAGAGCAGIHCTKGAFNNQCNP